MKSIEFTVLLCAFIFSTPIYAKTYQCVQENGITLYSDQECSSKNSVTTSMTVETITVEARSAIRLSVAYHHTWL